MFLRKPIYYFSSDSSSCLWEPQKEKIESSNLNKFIKFVEEKYNIQLSNFQDLYNWSVISEPNIKGCENFWSGLWDFCQIKAKIKGESVLINGDSFLEAQWFSQARLNFAENLLKKCDNDIALIFRGENFISRQVSFLELNHEVSKIQQFMILNGLRENDRIALFIPNMTEAVTILLAAASLGVICSFCSPDFGVQGVLDRFVQIEPIMFFYSDSCVYNGKIISNHEKIKEILTRLPSVKNVVCVPYFPSRVNESEFVFSGEKNYFFYHKIMKTFREKEIIFLQLPFNHPLYIMYSSGTTGVPKCIVHGAGGTLLQHMKEHVLHCNFKPGDRIFYYSTCGWMMWQWLISALSSQCTLLLYDGSPFYPSSDVLLKYIDEENASFFGVSAKYIDSLRKSGFIPKNSFSFKNLNTIGSTGSPLVAESFDFIYENVKKDVCLSSLSGGTDIISCFVLGNPIGKVYRGEIQTRGLGMKVEVYNENGKSVIAEKGELVCTYPFPSQPIYFWNDKDKSKYKASYFEKYDNIWHHGDWLELTSNGGVIIYGRSDSTLNPSGVRIGTSEIYRQVEQFDDILECIAVDQKWHDDNRIILFVRMRDGFVLSEKLILEIKNKLRKNCSPRHVPAKILSVPDIPKTKSGKIVEIAVKNIINNIEIKNKEAMANPECLSFYSNLNELSLE